MKNKNVKYSIVAISIVIISLFFVYIFPNKSPFNKPDNFWKAGDNAVFGDVLYILKEGNILRNDTIFTNEISVAVVLEVQDRFWAGDRVLKIKNIKTGEIGTYYEK